MPVSTRYCLTLRFLGLADGVFPAQVKAAASDQRLVRLIERFGKIIGLR